MKKYLLFLLPLSIFLAACNNIDPVLVAYNDNLVQYSNDADARVDEFYEKLDQAITTDNLSRIKELGKEAIDSIQSDIARIKNLEQPNGAQTFHNATLSYVESLIPYVEEISDMFPIIFSGETLVKDNINYNYPIIERADSILDIKLNDMIEAQKAFAKAKKLELED